MLVVFPVLTEATFPPAFSIIANMLWRNLLDLDHSNKMVKGKHTAIDRTQSTCQRRSDVIYKVNGKTSSTRLSLISTTKLPLIVLKKRSFLPSFLNKGKKKQPK